MTARTTYLQQVATHAGATLDLSTAKAELIEHFIKSLGYNLANPYELMAHFTDATGKKKKDPVVYALNKNGCPHILIAPHATNGQATIQEYPHLPRLFAALPHIQCIVLTDGLHFQLYSDTKTKKILDSTPSCTVVATDPMAINHLIKILCKDVALAPAP